MAVTASTPGSPGPCFASWGLRPVVGTSHGSQCPVFECSVPGRSAYARARRGPVHPREGGCPVQCGMRNPLPGPSPLHAGSITRGPPSCDHQRCLQILPRVPGGQNHPLVENYCARPSSIFPSCSQNIFRNRGKNIVNYNVGKSLLMGGPRPWLAFSEAISRQHRWAGT